MEVEIITNYYKMTIQDIENQIIAEFSNFEDWLDKYNYIIELGKDCPVINEKDKVNENLIKGCQSKVWLSAKLEEGRIRFRADSDAVITRGIVSLLIRTFDNQTPADILSADISFIEKIGLKEHLSPTRSNGLTAMLKQIKIYALAFQTLTQNQQ